MNVEFFILPELLMAGWYLINRHSAQVVAQEHSDEDAMLQHLRDYLHDGYEVSSRKALLQLTEKASEGAFQCKRQSFFLPHRDGDWSLGQSPLSPDESSLLAAIAAQGQPIERRAINGAVSPELTHAAHALMDHYGINVLVPVSDSMKPQWVWASYFAERQASPAVDALRAWQMAMQSVVERGALRLASAHLAVLKKDADSATQVLRVLLPDAPWDAGEGMEWAASLHRASGEPPVLFATYPQGPGKVLVVFAEVMAPGLAAVILGSALRGFCDSLVKSSKPNSLRPEKVLGRLNRYVWRPGQQSDVPCVVALFDTHKGCIDYAAAGEPQWRQVKASGEVVALNAAGPGLGAAEQIDYLPQTLKLSDGDSHVFVGSAQGPEVFSDPVVSKYLQSNRDVSFDGLGAHVDDLADSLHQIANGEGRTPAVVILRTST